MRKSAELLDAGRAPLPGAHPSRRSVGRLDPARPQVDGAPPAREGVGRTTGVGVDWSQRPVLGLGPVLGDPPAEQTSCHIQLLRTTRSLSPGFQMVMTSTSASSSIDDAPVMSAT